MLRIAIGKLDSNKDQGACRKTIIPALPLCLFPDLDLVKMKIPLAKQAFTPESRKGYLPT